MYVNETGRIFDIQRFSIHDGPGIRTNVFLKGCPLRCKWCHNPEGLKTHPDLSYNAEKCIGCGACAAVCPHGCHTIDGQGHRFDRSRCVVCGKCCEVCYTDALERLGREATVQEVLDEVLKDRPFYETSGGGMTLSGGEPLYQPRFAVALLAGAKEAGLHTCIETSGFCPEETLRSVMDDVDIFLFDIKETDPVRHEAFTGVSNKIILRNLHLLEEAGKSIVLRCPVIPGFNARDEHFRQVALLASSLRHVLRVELEPYHPLGISKSERLGRENGCDNRSFMSAADAARYRDLMQPLTTLEIKIN